MIAEIRAFPIMLEGRPLILGSARDITLRREAERALRESEEKYRKLFEAETDAIMLFDGESRQFVDANQATLDLYGYTREEFLGLKQQDITAEPEASDASIRKTLAEGLMRIPLRYHRKKDGTVFPAEITACSFSWQNRHILCGVIRDISERLHHEQELLAQRERLSQLASELSLAEERERRRIASELHDGLGQLLSACRMRLDVLRQSALSESVADTVETAFDLLREAIGSVRTLTYDLSTPVLNQLGLVPALEQLCDDLTAERGMRFECEDDGQPKLLSEATRIILYRCARELLINAAKHSKGRTACVGLRRVGQRIHIVVEDDGTGFDPATAGTGFSSSGGYGLFQMREYLRHIGGNMEIESARGSGTRVRVDAPLREEKPNIGEDLSGGGKQQ
jgi:PAS domain S-box-containing protein